jgi:hypothetical protein
MTFHLHQNHSSHPMTHVLNQWEDNFNVCHISTFYSPFSQDNQGTKAINKDQQLNMTALMLSYTSRLKQDELNSLLQLVVRLNLPQKALQLLSEVPSAVFGQLHTPLQCAYASVNTTVSPSSFRLYRVSCCLPRCNRMQHQCKFGYLWDQIPIYSSHK